MGENMENTGNREAFTDKDIFIRIWTSPRQVFKFIDDNKYDKFIVLLFFLSGILRSFDRAIIQNMGDKLSLLFIIGVCVIVGGFFGWISFWIYSFLIGWMGKWIGGTADTSSVLRVVGYSMIPSVVFLFVMFIQIMVCGEALFRSDGYIMINSNLFLITFYLVALILEIILVAWTLCLLVIGVSEIQGFLIWKSILNILMPGLLFIVVFVIITAIVSIIIF